MSIKIALIAHDNKKSEMISFVGEYLKVLRGCELIATGTTGTRLAESYQLKVKRLLSGPLGGDLQIGALLAEGQVDLVIFFRDPMTPQPHEPDINALVRACDVHNIPCATNSATARMLLHSLRG